jgi:hypothetical protein
MLEQNPYESSGGPEVTDAAVIHRFVMIRRLSTVGMVLVLLAGGIYAVQGKKRGALSVATQSSPHWHRAK